VTDAAPRRRTSRTATEPEPSEPSTTPSGGASDGARAKAKVRRADGLPRRGTSPVAEERSSLDLARRIVELAEDKKAADIVLLDLSPLTTVADYFVICSGGSERQLEAIASGIISAMRDEKVRPFGREGTAASHWILVDFGSVIVHIFTPPERDFYQLERHWAEAKTVLRLQ
jgi:ribosome-associated protein